MLMGVDEATWNRGNMGANLGRNGYLSPVDAGSGDSG